MSKTINDKSYSEIMSIIAKNEAKVDAGIVQEMLHSLDILAKKENIVSEKDNLILNKYERGFSTILSNNPQLHPVAENIAKAFEKCTERASPEIVRAIQESTNRALEENKIVGNPLEQSRNKELESIVTSLEKMASDKAMKSMIGKNSAKEFSQQIEQLREEFTKARPSKKEEVIKNKVAKLEEWCETKQQEAKTSNWKKFKQCLSSAVLAVNALCMGNQKSYQEHQLKFQQAGKELLGNAKEIYKGLGNIKEQLEPYKGTPSKSSNFVKPPLQLTSTPIAKKDTVQSR